MGGYWLILRSHVLYIAGALSLYVINRDEDPLPINITIMVKTLTRISHIHAKKIYHPLTITRIRTYFFRYLFNLDIHSYLQNSTIPFTYIINDPYELYYWHNPSNHEFLDKPLIIHNPGDQVKKWQYQI